jgi:hypothetical protein
MNDLPVTPAAPTLDWFCNRCRLRHREAVPARAATRTCRECRTDNVLPGAALAVAGPGEKPALRNCPACGVTDLWDKRDFPARLGYGLVVLGGGAAIGCYLFGHPFRAMAIFLGFALLDAAAHWLVPPLSVCYGCMAEIRGVKPDHGGFDIHRAEEYAHSLENLGEPPPFEEKKN